MKMPDVLRRARARVSAAQPPIGIHVGSRQVSVVQLQGRGSRVSVHAAGSLPLIEPDPDPAELVEKLGELRRSLPLRGRQVVSAIPAPDVKLMVLTYKLDEGESEDEAILARLAERMREPLDECVIDYMPIRNANDGQVEQSALVAVAGEETVFEYLESFRSAGFAVESLEITSVALRRLINWPGIRPAQDSVILLHGSASRCELTVLWGRRLILWRQIDFAEQQALAHLARNLDLEPDAAEDLVQRFGLSAPPDAQPDGALEAADISSAIREILKPSLREVTEQIRRAVIYTESCMRGGSVGHVLVTGTLARWSGIDELLGSMLDLEVRVVDPLALIERGVCGPRHGMEVACGLSLRGVSDE